MVTVNFKPSKLCGDMVHATEIFNSIGYFIGHGLGYNSIGEKAYLYHGWK